MLLRAKKKTGFMGGLLVLLLPEYILDKYGNAIESYHQVTFLY